MARTAKARKRPDREEPPSRLARIIDNIIRHKLKWIFGAVLGLGSSGMVAAYEMIEPGIPALHYWVRDMVMEDHNYIVYLKLNDAKLSLKTARTQLAKDSNDETAEKAIQYYESVITKYQKQLNKAAGN